jgi:hypothetical protein
MFSGPNVPPGKDERLISKGERLISKGVLNGSDRPVG